jgi:hypothetical protein
VYVPAFSHHPKIYSTNYSEVCTHNVLSLAAGQVQKDGAVVLISGEIVRRLGHLGDGVAARLRRKNRHVVGVDVDAVRDVLVEPLLDTCRVPRHTQLVLLNLANENLYKLTKTIMIVIKKSPVFWPFMSI